MDDFLEQDLNLGSYFEAPTPSPEPVSLDLDKQQSLGKKLQSACISALQSRSSLEQHWLEWERAYEAQPLAKKHTPWQNASNINIPIASIITDAIAARLANTVMGIKPVITVNANIPEYADLDKQIEDFVEQMSLSSLYLNMPLLFPDLMIGVCKRGTGVLKIIRELDHPKFIIIFIEDFIVPPECNNVQTSDWIAHRFRLNWSELKLRERDFGYQNLDKIKQQSTEAPHSDLTQESQKIVGIDNSVLSPTYVLYEVWCKLDLDKDEIDEDYVVTLESETGTILRIIKNPYEHKRRPFVIFNMVPRERSIYGIGIPEMTYGLRAELNTIHNQRRDNATIANTICLKGRAGTSVKPGVKIYPGKIFILNNPAEDLVPLVLGVVRPIALEEELITQSYIERRTGVSDYTLGRESSVAKTRATATGTLALIQEGNKRFDFMMRCVRASLVEAYSQVIELLAQYQAPSIYSNNQTFAVSVPKDFSRDKLTIQVTASSALVNREVEKQNLLVVIERMVFYYDKIMNLAMMSVNPQIPPELKNLSTKIQLSMTKLMERLLYLMEIKDGQDLLPNILESMQEQRAPQVLGGMYEGAGEPKLGLGGTPPDIGTMGGVGQPPGLASLAAGGGAPMPGMPNMYSFLQQMGRFS